MDMASETIMTDQGEVSRIMLSQFGAKLLRENPPDDEPANLIVSVMLCYRSDPDFWAEHLKAALATPCGRGIEAEEANIDQVMADWRRATEKAQRQLGAKG